MISILEYIKKTKPSDYKTDALVLVHVNSSGNKDGVEVHTPDMDFVIFRNEIETRLSWKNACAKPHWVVRDSHLPNNDEWMVIAANLDDINRKLREIGGQEIVPEHLYWSSTVDNNHTVYYFDPGTRLLYDTKNLNSLLNIRMILPQ